MEGGGAMYVCVGVGEGWGWNALCKLFIKPKMNQIDGKARR